MVSHGAEHTAITSCIRTGKKTIITMLCNNRFVHDFCHVITCWLKLASWCTSKSAGAVAAGLRIKRPGSKGGTSIMIFIKGGEEILLVASCYQATISIRIIHLIPKRPPF